LYLAASKFVHQKYYYGVKSMIRRMGHVACILRGRGIYTNTFCMRSHTGNSPLVKSNRIWEGTKRVYAKLIELDVRRTSRK
jgi:hypothetical protein